MFEIREAVEGINEGSNGNKITFKHYKHKINLKQFND
jgi:hypothetical protein